jgi:DNA-binding NtrC family response regulator
MALILLVEPDPGQRDDVRATLQAAGHLVEAVASAGDAERALAVTGHDFVICDVSLPDASGFDFVEQLEGRGRRAVGFVPQGERLLIEVHDNSYFCRPYSRDSLMTLIARNTETERPSRERSHGRSPAPLWPILGKIRGLH